MDHPTTNPNSPGHSDGNPIAYQPTAPSGEAYVAPNLYHVAAPLSSFPPTRTWYRTPVQDISVTEEASGFQAPFVIETEQDSGVLHISITPK